MTLKSFRGLKSEGSGTVVIENFSGSGIDIDAAGSGDMALKGVRPERLAIVIKGSGNIDASGSGKALVAHINGTGTIDAANFRAQSVDANISGSGDIRVHAD